MFVPVFAVEEYLTLQGDFTRVVGAILSLRQSESPRELMIDLDVLGEAVLLALDLSALLAPVVVLVLLALLEDELHGTVLFDHHLAREQIKRHREQFASHFQHSCCKDI